MLKLDLDSFMQKVDTNSATLEIDCKYYLDYYKCDDNPRNFIYEMTDDYIEHSSNYTRLKLYYTFFQKMEIKYNLPPNHFIASKRINSFPELPNLKIFKCAGLRIDALAKLENLMEIECDEHLVRFIINNKHLFPRLKIMHDFDNKSYYYF